MDAQKLWAGLGLLATILITWALIALMTNAVTQFFVVGILSFLVMGAALALAWMRGQHAKEAAADPKWVRLRLTDRNNRTL